MKNANTMRAFLVAMIATACSFQVQIQVLEYEENLARQLSNPVAALIIVPIHLNYNQNLGLSARRSPCCFLAENGYTR